MTDLQVNAHCVLFGFIKNLLVKEVSVARARQVFAERREAQHLHDKNAITRFPGVGRQATRITPYGIVELAQWITPHVIVKI